MKSNSGKKVRHFKPNKKDTVECRGADLFRSHKMDGLFDKPRSDQQTCKAVVDNDRSRQSSRIS